MRKGARFLMAGLGSLGVIFSKSYSGSKNKKPNKNQVEQYKNKDKGTYKPNYYSIQPKAVNSKMDKNQGIKTYDCNYNPDVDPLKLQQQQNRPRPNEVATFGFKGNMNDEMYEQERQRRIEIQRMKYYDQQILQVIFFF